MLDVFGTVITIPGAVIDVHWPVKGSRLTRSLQGAGLGIFTSLNFPVFILKCDRNVRKDHPAILVKLCASFVGNLTTPVSSSAI
jgi:hypothetical protein